MLKIGIDPGLEGAIAFIGPSGIRIDDMPVMQKTTGKGRMVNTYALGSALSFVRSHLVDDPESVVCYCEDVHAMPAQGVNSVFSFGRSLGAIEGVLGAFRVPIVMVRPTAWKKAAGISGRDKDAARTLALRLYPHLEDMLARKKDIGRADALLLAHFGGDA